MSIPADDTGGGPRTLAFDPDAPTIDNAPLNPDYRPQSKDEAKSNISVVTDRFDDYKRTQLRAHVPIRIIDGDVMKWQEGSKKPKPEGWTDELWDAYPGNGASDGKWVPDTAGQLLLDDIDYAERLAKELTGSGPAARSALSIESDKTDEISRQMKDFAYRADLTYDLYKDEQSMAMAADDQNAANMKTQRDYGLASMPSYGTPYASQSLSSIMRPSLPDYVSPDYRLNSVVGLPGGEGFNDPDYDQYGMPAYARGTARVWRWGRR